ISPFGLVEMSRQRLRSSVLESTTQICVNCKGAGYVRSAISIAIYILRKLEEKLLQDNTHNLRVKTNAEYALQFFNKKKNQLIALEQRFNVNIEIEAAELAPDKLMIIEKTSMIPANKKEIVAEKPEEEEKIPKKKKTPIKKKEKKEEKAEPPA